MLDYDAGTLHYHGWVNFYLFQACRKLDRPLVIVRLNNAVITNVIQSSQNNYRLR
jgi:hypothetical protein